MKKILLATAAAMTMGLSIATASAASATTPTPEPSTQFGQVPQFGHDPRPVPVQRDCRTIRFIDPRDGGGPVGHPYPSASETATEAALAAFHGVPSPEPSQQFGQDPRFGHDPRINPLNRCRPEHFNVIQAWVGPGLSTVIANYAAATGPVNGTGSDTQLANTRDRLNLSSGRVVLDHNGIGIPFVNTNNCTASLLQFGTWRFNGGTGLNLHAVGNGTYRLALLAHFPQIRGTCALNLLSGNPLLQHRVSPDALTVAVHGDGLARR